MGEGGPSVWSMVGRGLQESKVLWVLALTHSSRLCYQASDPKEAQAGFSQLSVCLSLCLLGPSGTPRTAWPSRRDGTQGEC